MLLLIWLVLLGGFVFDSAVCSLVVLSVALHMTLTMRSMFLDLPEGLVGLMLLHSIFTGAVDGSAGDGACVVASAGADSGAGDDGSDAANDAASLIRWIACFW